VKYRLPAEMHALQQAMSTRQVLCIDDPMELGRSLGASFQGFERLCFEWRRAYHLLCRGPDSEKDDAQRLRDVFCDKPAPPRSIYNLEKHRSFPVLTDRSDRRIERERVHGNGRAWYSASSHAKGDKGGYKGDWWGGKGEPATSFYVRQPSKGKDTPVGAKGLKEGKDGRAAKGAKGSKGHAEGKGLWQ